MKNSLENDATYNPRRDGSLDDFLSTHTGHRAFPSFKGYEPFKLLWDQGYLSPGLTTIRIIWNDERENEHYLVLEEFKLMELKSCTHYGIPGEYDPRKLLVEGSFWEAIYLKSRSIRIQFNSE